MSRVVLCTALSSFLIGCGPPHTAPSAPAPAPAPGAEVIRVERPPSQPKLAAVVEAKPGPVNSTLDAAAGVASDDAFAKEPVSFELLVAIPMRDGVELSARIYRPANASGPVPALVVKTPYNATNYHRWGMYFARRGYAVALVDARGRGESSGEFRAFETDGQDGYDVVEWLASRPWCSGKVGMFGGSYDGFGQWATVRYAPPHLSTVVPVAAVGPGVDFPMWNNVSYPYAMRWLTYVSGHALHGAVFGDDSMFDPIYEEVHSGKIPFRDLDARMGNPSPTYRTWQQHPTLDEYWRGLMPGPAQFAKTEIPILTITGHYDDDQVGALNYYRGHMKHGSKRGKERHYLVVGPWDHGGTRYPNAVIGGMRVGGSSVLDMMDLHHKWFDWTLKGGKKPEFLRKRVAYFVIGKNEWRYAREFSAATSGSLVFYLDSDGRADDVHHSGTLAVEAPTVDGADAYRVSPLDPRLMRADAATGMDVPVVNRGDAAPPAGLGLVYHSAPFDESTEIVGGAVLEMEASMDVPDTDFWVGLFEVRPDGQTVYLSSTVLRARDQGGLSREGAVRRYTIDDFTYFAHRIGADSRLRLVIAPPMGKSWQRNFQSGGVVAEETAKDARTGTIRVHHGGAHPSRLTLGVVGSEPR